MIDIYEQRPADHPPIPEWRLTPEQILRAADRYRAGQSPESIARNMDLPEAAIRADWKAIERVSRWGRAA